jgi:hypothetical protein
VRSAGSLAASEAGPIGRDSSASGTQGMVSGAKWTPSDDPRISGPGRSRARRRSGPRPPGRTDRHRIDRTRPAPPSTCPLRRRCGRGDRGRGTGPTRRARPARRPPPHPRRRPRPVPRCRWRASSHHRHGWPTPNPRWPTRRVHQRSAVRTHRWDRRVRGWWAEVRAMSSGLRRRSVCRRARQVPSEQGTTPRTKPSSSVTKLTDWARKPEMVGAGLVVVVETLVTGRLVVVSVVAPGPAQAAGGRPGGCKGRTPPLDPSVDAGSRELHVGERHCVDFVHVRT